MQNRLTSVFFIFIYYSLNIHESIKNELGLDQSSGVRSHQCFTFDFASLVIPLKLEIKNTSIDIKQIL